MICAIRHWIAVEIISANHEINNVNHPATRVIMASKVSTSGGDEMETKRAAAMHNADMFSKNYVIPLCKLFICIEATKVVCRWSYGDQNAGLIF